MKQPFKLLLNFVSWGEPRFGTKANHIMTAMTTEPMKTLVKDPLPAAVPSRATGLQALADYKAAAILADDGGHAAISNRKEKRAILEGILKGWAPYLELVAKQAGTITILVQSGYDLRRPNLPVTQPLSAPELKVFRNGFSDQVHGRSKPLPGALCYEGQLCPGANPQTGDWQTVFFTTRPTQLKYEGLTPGQMYSFRLRALGRDGWSPWSAIARLMAA